MIEVLVKYIEDKGYDVDVLPGRVFLSRIIEDQICGVWWMIPSEDLRPELEECLYWEAHKRMKQIDKAIAEREAASDTSVGQDGRMG